MSPSLGDYCAIIMGQAPPGDTYSATDGIPLIAGAGDFSKGQLKPKKFTTKPSKLSKTGDIVLSIRASIGDKVWADGEYCLGRGVAALRPGSNLDGGFLWQWLDHAEPSLQAKAKGATFLQVNRSDIADLRIAPPPLDEQRRIAAILDKADELRTKRREALAHLDTLTQSIFHSMFRSTVPDALLSDAIGSLVGGKNVVGPDDSPNAFRVLKISSVTSGRYLETESKPLPDDYKPPRDHVVRDGDVIISRANTTELVGASALVESTNGTSVLPDKLWRAVPTSRTDSRFLVATLQSVAVRGEISRRSSGTGGSMKNISQPKLLSIPIALPPLDLQQTFATRVAAAERLKESHRKHLAELDALFASLQHRAFKGEL